MTSRQVRLVEGSVFLNPAPQNQQASKLSLREREGGLGGRAQSVAVWLVIVRGGGAILGSAASKIRFVRGDGVGSFHDLALLLLPCSDAPVSAGRPPWPKEGRTAYAAQTYRSAEYVSA